MTATTTSPAATLPNGVTSGNGCSGCCTRCASA